MLKKIAAIILLSCSMGASVFAQSQDVSSAVNDLSSKSGAVRQNAVMTLGSSNDKRYASDIERLARDSDSGVRTAVCWALGQFKSPSSEQILNVLARDSRPEVRQAAVNALGNYKSVATGETLLRATYDSDINVKKSAINSLARVKYQLAGSRLSALLSDSDADVRAAAAIAIKSMNFNAPSSMVAAGMRDEDSRVRSGSAENLGISGNEDAISVILPGLKDLNPSVRKNAAASLGNTKSPKTIPYLIEAMSDHNKDVGLAASESLSKVGAPAVESIAETIEKSGVEVQELCVRALAGMGDLNVDLLESYSKRPEIRNIAIWGLGETRSKRAFSAVLDGMNDASPEIRQTSVEAMGKLGTAVIPDLKEALEEAPTQVRECIAKSLGYMPYTTENADFLVSIMADEEDTVAAEASVSLSRFGEYVRPLLLDMLKSDDEMQRTGSINALALMGKESAPQLRECLNDRSAKVRAGAALGLGQMGAQEAGDEIITLFEQDNDPDVKQACAWTIGKICSPSDYLMHRLVLEKTRAASKNQTALQRTIEETIAIFENQ